MKLTRLTMVVAATLMCGTFASAGTTCEKQVQKIGEGLMEAAISSWDGESERIERKLIITPEVGGQENFKNYRLEFTVEGVIDGGMADGPFFSGKYLVEMNSLGDACYIGSILSESSENEKLQRIEENNRLRSHLEAIESTFDKNSFK